jgi:hypothetical protein
VTKFSKQEIVNELYRLYLLKQAGKHVDQLIEKFEEMLCEKCDEELDTKEVDEED